MSAARIAASRRSARALAIAVLPRADRPLSHLVAVATASRLSPSVAPTDA